MSDLKYNICNNYSDYLEVAKSLYYNGIFEMESWDEFFNAHLKYNEDTGIYIDTIEDFQGSIDYRPNNNEYPVIVTYEFNEDWDRWGKCEFQVWDWISFKELINNTNKDTLIKRLNEIDTKSVKTINWKDIKEED